MSLAYCCEVCDATDPHWTIMRRGDVVVSWACDAHLAVVCERLQRDSEITELIVRDSRKAREWAAIGRSLDKSACVSTTRFADAVAALLAAYTGAAAFAGVPVYDGPQPTGATDPDFVIVGHDASMAADGTLETTALAGTYLQEWSDMTTGREERGSVSRLIVSQGGDVTDMPGRRARVTTLLAAAEDAASAAQVTHLTFDGTTDGRWLTRQGAAGVAVICAYRVSRIRAQMALRASGGRAGSYPRASG